MARHCDKCESKVGRRSRFCESCGADLGEPQDGPNTARRVWVWVAALVLIAMIPLATVLGHYAGYSRGYTAGLGGRVFCLAVKGR